jgi:TonB family protein
VILRLVVGVSGRAEQIRVVKSLAQRLDENAVAAVSRWEFQPGTWKGQPCATVATVEVSFRAGRDQRRPPELIAAIRTAFADPKNAKEALKVIEQGVEQNIPMANRTLGGFLVDGKVIKKDVKRGLRLLREAAMEGDRSALYSVAKMHIDGRYLEHNPQLGAVLMTRSADLGFPKAAEWAALQHQEGGLLPKSEVMAEQYFRRCASAHIARCKTSLAKILLEREPRQNAIRAEAFAWLASAAKQGETAPLAETIALHGKPSDEESKEVNVYLQFIDSDAPAAVASTAGAGQRDAGK